MDQFNNIDQSCSTYKPNWFIFTIIFKGGGGFYWTDAPFQIENDSVIFDSQLSNEMVKNDDW